MRMKIGILTFHYPNNYGALLQSYSLISYLRQMNLEAEIIDYVPSLFKESSFFSGSKTLRGFMGNILRIPFYKKWRVRNFKLNNFRNYKIIKSERINDNSNIFFKYDIVITGSDQTFNRSFSYTNIYYQNYEKPIGHKKIAYAPSFGSMDMTIKPDFEMLKSIMDFDSLSCREIEGVEYLKKNTGLAVSHVLDPVFLTDKESWSKLASNKETHSNYVFIYDLNGKMPMINLAKEMFPNKKLIVFSNDVLMPFYARKVSNISFVQDIGVEEFLSYIKDADFVMTDSFHGTAFSIIFEKQFYTYIALEKAAGRIRSLLHQLNLNDRIVRKDEWNNSIIDYPNIMLNSLIQKSKDYLIHSIYEN